jgi:hypothetical protein
MIKGHTRVNRVTLFASIPVLAFVALAAGCGTATAPSTAGGTGTARPSSASPGTTADPGETLSPGATASPTAVPTTTAGPPLVAGQPACTDWPASAPRESLPRTFVPVAVLRCVNGEQTIPGKGEWQTATLQRADKDLGALIAALRLPPGVRSPGMMCPDLVMLPPQIVLVSADGKTLIPRLPVGDCGLIQGPVLAAIAALPWQTVSVRLVAQVQSQAEASSGCAPSYKDPFVLYESARQVSGGTLYTAPPTSLQICVYALGGAANTSHFLSGTTVTGPTLTTLVDGLSSPLHLTVCSLPHEMFAVLSGSGPGSTVVYVELGGCDRVYRPESVSGGLMGVSTGQATPDTVSIIESVTHAKTTHVPGGVAG